MKEYYEVRLILATEDGDPDEWGWEDLIGDTVIEVNSKKMELVEVAKSTNFSPVQYADDAVIIDEDEVEL